MCVAFGSKLPKIRIAVRGRSLLLEGAAIVLGHRRKRKVGQWVWQWVGGALGVAVGGAVGGVVGRQWVWQWVCGAVGVAVSVVVGVVVGGEVSGWGIEYGSG